MAVKGDEDTPMGVFKKISEGKYGVVITIGTILGLLSFGVIVWYVQNPGQRDAIRFGVIAFTAAAGITSAYYVAASLRETTTAGARSLQETVQANMLARTFQYTQRWGDPAFDEAKQAVRLLIQDVHGDRERGRKIREMTERDAALERSIISTMNYLEELALAIHEGFVDGAVQKRLVRGTVIRYWETLKPWVEESRDERGPAIFAELERLYKRWK